MTTIYHGMGAKFTFEDSEFVSTVPERSTGTPTSTYSTSKSVKGITATTLLRLQDSDASLLVGITGDTDATMGVAVHIDVDGTRLEMQTDDLGEAEVLLDPVPRALCVQLPQHEIRLLEVEIVPMTPDQFDSLLVVIDGPDSHISVPTVGLRVGFDGTEAGLAAAFDELLEAEVETERGQVISYDKFYRNVPKLGFKLEFGGKHPQLVRGGDRYPMPFHKGDMRKGTLNAFLKHFDLSFDDVNNPKSSGTAQKKQEQAEKALQAGHSR